MHILIKLLELLAAGGLFGAALALPGKARLRVFGFAAAAGLLAVSVGRGLIWDWSLVHLMPMTAGGIVAVLAWRRLRFGLALVAALYLAWVAQRGW